MADYATGGESALILGGTVPDWATAAKTRDGSLDDQDTAVIVAVQFPEFGPWTNYIGEPHIDSDWATEDPSLRSGRAGSAASRASST